MKKEKIGQNIFFFSDCEDRGLEFWGLVGSNTSAESVTKKPKQKNKKKKGIRDSVGQGGFF